jgi:hypothetical protein
VPYTVAMLLRVVRLTVVGSAVLLTLHLFMLIGHGHAEHGSMPPPGGVTHAAMATDQQPHPTLDLDTSLRAGVDMAATCFAILAGLLLLGAGARRIIRTPGLTASARAAGGAAGRPVRPRARSPVELCVSRS